MCTNPRWISKNNVLAKCGKCEHCRLALVKEWAMRITHEAESYKNKVFLTLTYANEFLPENDNLKKRDLQLFWKRLRTKLCRIYGKNYKIKYYACGEYGTKTGRAHYHAIIYNVGFEHKNIINDAWGMGHIKLGTVKNNSACYVAGYIEKKWSKDYSKLIGKTQQYSTSSQGIGKAWCLKHEAKIREDLAIIVKGKERPIPRYYRKILDITVDNTPELAKKLNERWRSQVTEIAQNLRLKIPVKYLIDIDLINVKEMYNSIETFHTKTKGDFVRFKLGLKRGTNQGENIPASEDELAKIKEIIIDEATKFRFWERILVAQNRARKQAKLNIQAKQKTYRKHRVKI